MLEQILEAVAGELDGEKALHFTERLTHFDRLPGSRGYHDAAGCVEEMLHECGVGDIVRQRVPLAAGVKYWSWDLGQRCYQDKARLELVEPWPELLLDAVNVPICIARASQPTPLGGEQGQVVDVGPGDVPQCYENVDVAGKVVLARGKPDEVARLAIHQHGAIGVLNEVLLMEFPPLRTRDKYPDLIQWQRLSKENDKPETARGWGFAISHTMSLRLKELLSKGRVIVRATVTGGWRDSHFDNIVATVPGADSGGKQFWFVAHLCHAGPGAGDNASGCGLMIEIARVLTALIAAGKIPRPRADCKFLFCPEMIGSLTYVHDHLPEMRGSLGGVCLDMVGQDQAQTGGALFVTRAPNSLPSIVSDVTQFFLERQEQSQQFWNVQGRGLFKYVMGPYVGLSDHYNFCDADIAVPMVSFVHWPDIYYHTSHDSIDKMSAHTFSIVGNTAASVALALSLPSEAGMRQMLELAANAAGQRLQELAEDARRTAESAISAGEDTKVALGLHSARIDLETVVETETAVLHQVLEMLPVNSDRSRLDAYLTLLDQSLRHQLEEQMARLVALVGRWPNAPALADVDAPIPRRQSQGPLNYTDFFQTTTAEDFETLILASEFWNFIDGSRSLDEIERLMRLEYGPIREGRLAQLLDRMVELGYAAL